MNADGVVELSACESEGRIVVRRTGVGIGMDEVVEGSILVEAMDLSAVMGFEETKEVDEEVVDLDDRFIGDWRQADLDRI
jgi:hypothetical protein